MARCNDQRNNDVDVDKLAGHVLLGAGVLDVAKQMKNVVIYMQSRTGSSMVASVFYAHGWRSNAELQFSRDYITHENQRVKAHLIATYGLPQTPVLAAEPDVELRHIIDDEFGGAPWVWKGDLFYASVLSATFSDLAPIYVKRNVEDAVRSGLAYRFFPRRINGKLMDYEAASENLGRLLRVKYALMDELCAVGSPGVIVDSTRVMEGDLEPLQRAISFAGGLWSERIARSAIKAPVYC